MTQVPYGSSELRRGIRDFGFGKVANGAITFLLLVGLARALSPEHYAAYLILVSIGSISQGLSGLGIQTAGSMFLPRFRLQTGKRGLVAFIAASTLLRLISVLVAIAVIALLMTPITNLFQVSAFTNELRLYLAVIVLETLCVHIQHALFEPLLRQGASQVTWLVRNLVFLAALIWLLTTSGSLVLHQVVWIAMISMATASLFGLVILVGCVKELIREATPEKAPEAPTVREVVRTAALDHMGLVMRVSGSTSAVTLVAGAFLTPQALAAFGFTMALADQIRAYLPTQLFWRIVQPSLVADYATTGGFRELNNKVFLLYKAGLFVLAPVVAVFAAHGSFALEVLSDGRYQNAAWMMLGWLVALIPLSHEIILWGTGMIVRRPDRIAWAGVSSLMTVPTCLLLSWLGLGSAGLIFSVTFSTIVYNSIIMRGLRTVGFRYRIDFSSILKISIAGLAATLCLVPIQLGAPSLPPLVGICALSVFVHLGACWFLGPFRRHEREWVYELMPGIRLGQSK